MVLRVAPNVDAEKTAHRFAGAFLMPAETLRAEMGARRRSIGWSELFDLKQLFGVSVQALTVRGPPQSPMLLPLLPALLHPLLQ